MGVLEIFYKEAHQMSAKRSVVVGGFRITEDELTRNGASNVASNRLLSSGKNPTDRQIQSLAGDLQEKFSKGPVKPSVPRF
jgi:hypothetical protein